MSEAQPKSLRGGDIRHIAFRLKIERPVESAADLSDAELREYEGVLQEEIDELEQQSMAAIECDAFEHARQASEEMEWDRELLARIRGLLIRRSSESMPEGAQAEGK